ncbi:MAG: ribonuclease E/G [Waddliaceae bacterium]|jgi:ribonuclease G|nr:ribonuclease E/G [Waddliaceae bacterium]MBT3578408.1 ribonuclease E/G [Waddliaceae bacterium]MBT4445260.1 ribonuclease E/G [Waddliaceae bacterium]MBT6929142.1 ribonuclease E/G [Waddliaceae bacterium]MBT7264641.1 ribonuclease E/G [Waddliaceae bacterium]
MEEILLNIESKERRYAHLKNGKLYDLVVERKKSRQLTGNIYKGKVINILQNIQSAFIDIDEGENGFIHISDILENTAKFEKMFDMDFDAKASAKDDATSSQDIVKLLDVDQPVLVQVVKEPIGSKGARLTSNVSIAGRYLVLLPNTPHRGVSRKIEDRNIRDRLKRTIRAFEMPQDMGLICRTASRQATTEMLIAEATELLTSWNEVMEKFNKSPAPNLLFEESDLIKRSVITAIDKKLTRLLIDDYDTYQRCKKIYAKYIEEHPLRIEYYRDKIPMFEKFNIDREIDKSLNRKIWLHSGGYLFFERTEAMWTIDVNSGRSKSVNSDVEEVIVRINLEAADEIARQMRLRNVGGLIICDFIDMRFRKNKRRVLERLKDCMKEDSAKCTILRMSDFGLIEMTRQRNRESLTQTMFIGCPYCRGSGTIKTHESVSIEIERAFKKALFVNKQFGLKLVCHPALDAYLDVQDKEYLLAFADDNNARLEFGVDDAYHLNTFEIFSTISGDVLEV